jgi:hypothetical protein
MTSPVPETAAGLTDRYNQTRKLEKHPDRVGPLQNHRTILAVVCVSG